MKVAFILFSLLANIVLVAVAVKRAASSEQPTSATLAGKESSATAGGTIAATDAANMKALRGAWTQVGSADLSALVAKLRAQGFPASMVAAITRALVLEQYKIKFRELQGSDDDHYWKIPAVYADPKRLAAMRALYHDQEKQLRDLLGDGADANVTSDYGAAQQQRRFGDIAPEKARQAERVLRDYSELTSDVYTAAQGGAVGGMMVLLPEDREKLAYLEKQKREDLAKVLSPDELLGYDLRTSNTATGLRRSLLGFNPTEEEFRALFQFQQGVDESLGLTTGVRTLEQYQSRQAALKDLQPQIDAALGPERAAEYKQAMDPQYQTANRLVARLDLPQTAAVEIVAVQKDIQKQAAAVKSNQSLSADDRAAQLSALTDDANRRLSAALGGTRGLDAYKQYNGSWLTTLKNGPAMRTRTP